MLRESSGSPPYQRSKPLNYLQHFQQVLLSPGVFPFPVVVTISEATKSIALDDNPFVGRWQAAVFFYRVRRWTWVFTHSRLWFRHDGPLCRSMQGKMQDIYRVYRVKVFQL
jgi:hypothetical protein